MKNVKTFSSIVIQEEAMLEKGKRAKVNFSWKKIAVIALILVIFASLEVYAHNYVQIHSLPVVDEDEVHKSSSWRYYTGTCTFSRGGCRWLVGWIIRRPAPWYGYVDIFKIEENRSFFTLSTDVLILGLKATSNNTENFWARLEKIYYADNYTSVVVSYDFNGVGTYQISFSLQVQIYERTLLGLIPKEEITLPINATVYYGP